jgi:tetratricopeptide (TPR) repeat protein
VSAILHESLAVPAFPTLRFLFLITTAAFSIVAQEPGKTPETAPAAALEQTKADAPPSPVTSVPLPEAAPVTLPPQPAGAVPKAGIATPGSIGELPNHTTVLAQRAATAFGEQKWEEARAAYEEMLKLDENNALAWANLGAVEQQAGKTLAAVECFQRSVEINPHLAQSWSALGLIFSSEGDTYRAISCFTRAIHEEPGDARAHNYLAIAAKNLGWVDAAQNELLRAIELNPQYGIANFNLALLYLDQKPPAIELAKRHYDKAVSLGVEKDEIVERRLKE